MPALYGGRLSVSFEERPSRIKKTWQETLIYNVRAYIYNVHARTKL